MLNRILQSKAFAIIIIAGIVFLGISMWGRYESYKNIKKEILVLEQKMEDFRARQRDYKRTINERYLERQARIELNYRNPEEKVVYIYRNTDDSTTDASAAHAQGKGGHKNNLQLWLEYVFGIE